MIDFKLFGIPIRVLPWFWATLGILGALSFNLSDSAGLLKVLLFVMAGFVSILIHELGHALMVRLYKQPTQIVLEAFGGYATHPAGSLNRLQSFLMTAAGPAIQILLAVIILIQPLADVSLGRDYEPATNGHFFLQLLAQISIFWAILNCMPIIPLDGGRMLDAILGPKYHRITLIIGIISGILLAIAGYAYLGSPMIAIFMGMFAYQNFQRLQQSS